MFSALALHTTRKRSLVSVTVKVREIGLPLTSFRRSQEGEEEDALLNRTRRDGASELPRLLQDIHLDGQDDPVLLFGTVESV